MGGEVHEREAPILAESAGDSLEIKAHWVVTGCWRSSATAVYSRYLMGMGKALDHRKPPIESMQNASNRAMRQCLESLQRAGVSQIPRPSPIDSEEADRSDGSTKPSKESRSAMAGAESARSNTQPKAGAAASSAADRRKQLNQLAATVAQCTACEELCAKRTQTVFGTGDPNARLCFLGEAPGADEDRLGEPFVGRAGKLLTKIIEAMTLTRDEVYILNTLKCRPPGNRNPTSEEVAHCWPFFEQQLRLIQPEFICCLGAVASNSLLQTTTPISQLRGSFHDWNGYRVLATYHPAYLLRNPSAKADVWDDMKILMREMGIKVPS